MPSAGPDDQLDASPAPDFIAVARSDGRIIGYVPKGVLFSALTTLQGDHLGPTLLSMRTIFEP